MFRKVLGATVASGALALALVGPVGAQNQSGDTLINVQVSDVTILVPIGIAANLCDIGVNVLAEQVDAGNTRCEADAESVASPGTGNNGGGGNTAGDSLVNVQIDDVLVAVPVALAANICDLDINVVAAQASLGNTICSADATATS